jgi:hypothetical protein
MLWESKVKDIISGSIYDCIKKERQDEIKNIGMRWDFYKGNQQHYIRKFEHESKKEYEEKLKIVFNYTMLVVDAYVNSIFGKPFFLKFEDEAINEIWESIYSKMVFNKIPTFMMTVQRIAEISDTCGIISRYDEKNKEMKFEHIPGEHIFPFPDIDNPQEIGEIAIFYNFYTGNPKDPTYNYLEIWDKETFSVFKWSDKTKKFIGETIDKEPNPYGFIPIVLFQPKKDHSSFYGITNIGDVVNINKIYNDLWTDLGVMVDFQSFSTMVVRSSNKLEFTIAPKRMIKIAELDPESSNNNEEVKYITPDAKLDAVSKILEEIKKELKNISLIPDSIVQTGSIGQVASGYSLKIKRMPFEEFINNKKTSYGPSMLEFAKMAVKVDQYHKTGDMPENNKLTATIDFSESPNMYSPQEQMATDEFNLRYNLTTPIQLLIRKNPDLTIKEAEELYEKNKKFNEKEQIVEEESETEDTI